MSSQFRTSFLWALLVIISLFFTIDKLRNFLGNLQNEQIEFNELGINLYGKFRFESEGELFYIATPDSRGIVPDGAVLTCIRSGYSIGYYSGGATIKNGASTIMIPKVFFVLMPSGQITFHMPSADGNFPGQSIPAPNFYDPLYKVEPPKSK